MNKVNKLIVGLLSVNAVFGNSLPPCIENTLPPTFDCSLKNNKELRKVVEKNRYLKLKFFDYRYKC